MVPTRDSTGLYVHRCANVMPPRAMGSEPGEPPGGMPSIAGRGLTLKRVLKVETPQRRSGSNPCAAQDVETTTFRGRKLVRKQVFPDATNPVASSPEYRPAARPTVLSRRPRGRKVEREKSSVGYEDADLGGATNLDRKVQRGLVRRTERHISRWGLKVRRTRPDHSAWFVQCVWTVRHDDGEISVAEPGETVLKWIAEITGIGTIRPLRE
ncbi:hypothetical protein C8Q74DRAFT_1291265 [Fomes fomentarius]|nr:hypothetical protein C8Q74DRAFT_1291265 [Fomes fomentarius]